MKINSITNLYNSFRINRNNIENRVSSPFNNKLVGDVVTFRAKAYSSDSVENPTNHCAYCGCKVYSEQQIESLAKEMLRDSSHRLQGDIKSVLEKLEAAVRSEELTVAKQSANKKEIEFYKKLLQQAEDKAWLKGEAIFQQVYGVDSDEAFVHLKKNLRPLTRTIDHVSPQKLGEDNKDEDINLVEACYCCNHDLKEGMPFSEFYKMYPSIKENMPVDKFKFAHAQALASSSSVFTELNVPAKKKIEFVSGLLALRDKAISQLNSVNFRIAESVPSLEYSIQECQEEIEQKDAEIIDFKAKLASISGDEEYQAMLERQSLLSKQEQLDEEVASLKEKRQNISNAKNELENPPKKGKKAKSKLSDDQKQQKIASYKMQLMDLKTQIQLKEDEQAENQRQLAALDELYPTPEILQARKNSYDSIISAYSQLDDEQSKYSVLSGISSKLEFDIQQLEQEIETYPSEPFDVSKYTPDEQLQYQQYSALFDALKYIDQHSNNGGVKSVVNRSAKIQIEKEMEEMADFPVVVAATNFLKRKDLIAQKEKTIKEKEENEKNVLVSRRKIEQLQKVTSQCSLDEAKKQSVDISAWIRRLNDKQNYLQIPKTIEKLEAEIILLRRTISSLSEKKAQITSLGNLQT